MSSSRWQTISQIFEAALDLPAGERESFVHKACNGDPGIEAEVIRLLAGDENAGSFLEHPALSTLPARTTPRSSILLSEGLIVGDRFRIVRFIGQGGMGQVYEALDLELNSRIALKVIRPEIAVDERMLSRFRREVQLTRMITHPNVCRTFDIERQPIPAETGGDAKSLSFLTMELLEGETLSSLLRRQGRMSVNEALPLADQMIDALAAAHAVGVIHRDFKPSNILLVPAGATRTALGSGASSSRLIASGSPGSSSGPALRAVVTDFGLARIVTSDISEHETGSVAHSTSLTGDQALMGTLVYMAPEQFERGEVSMASDIYSLGLVLFEMVTGRRPFADDIPFAEATKRLKQPAPLPSSLVPDVPADWDVVISRCLALDPNDRFETVQQVAEALHHPTATAATAEAAHKPASRQPARHKLLATVAIVVVVVSLSLAGLRLYQVRGEAKLAEGSSVLLTNIQNGTGDKRFDDTTELVRHQLLQSPYFSLMDTDRIRHTLGEMVKPEDSPLDPQTAREVAMRNGVRRVVFGAVSRVGDSYVLDLNVEQPDNSPLRFRQHWNNHWTWSMSGSTNARGADKDMPSEFLDAVRNSSDWIRQQIGESANDIAQLSAPPEDVTTANWQALSDFAQAERFRAARNNDATVTALRDAVDADPNFALGYARLGDVLVSLQRYTEGYAAYGKAIALGEQRLTLRERYRISGIYALDTWDYVKANKIFEAYTQKYKHDYFAWFYLGANLVNLGHVEAAIAALKTAVEADQTKMHAPAHIARFDLILGDFSDAEKWIQRVRELSPEDADFIEGESDFLQGRYQDSEALFERLKATRLPIYRSYGYSLLTRLYAEEGQDQKALSEVEQGIMADRESGDRAHEADKIMDRASIRCGLRQYDLCIDDTKQSLSLDRSLPRSLNAARLLGQAAYGTTGTSRAGIWKCLKDIESELAEKNLEPMSDIVGAHVTGEVFLADDLWERALEKFKETDGIESSLTDKEYLGRAMMAGVRRESLAGKLKQRSEALAAFTELTKKPGLVWQEALTFPPGYLRSAHARFVSNQSE